MLTDATNTRLNIIGYKNDSGTSVAESRAAQDYLVVEGAKVPFAIREMVN